MDCVDRLFREDAVVWKLALEVSDDQTIQGFLCGFASSFVPLCEPTVTVLKPGPTQLVPWAKGIQTS